MKQAWLASLVKQSITSYPIEEQGHQAPAPHLDIEMRPDLKSDSLTHWYNDSKNLILHTAPSIY